MRITIQECKSSGNGGEGKGQEVLTEVTRLFTRGVKINGVPWWKGKTLRKLGSL